jgi:corrinoid protein of di/trimethylamine methyltransferase
MSKVLAQLKQAILDCNPERAADVAGNAVAEGLDLIDTANAAIVAIKQVGDSYGRGEAWLPDLIGAANAMTAAMSVIEKELAARGEARKGLGSIVIGTVHGDIHNIGKDMVATLARADGFNVIDLGIDVKNEVFVEAIKKHCPDLLAMSALLTTTAHEQAKVIRALEDNGLREKVKVVVGGGAITADFAKMIGADGYEPTAPRAVKLFEELVATGGRDG